MRGLDKLRVLGRANDMHRGPGGLIVESDAGRIKAQRVLLALGLTEQPRWPAWAKNLQERGGRVDHLFSRDVQRAGRGQEETVVVVGGGISAVQAALRLAKDGAGSVVLLSRHRLREVPFDFNPCWIGPKCMRGFVRLPIGERRPVIDAARQPGTAPAEVMAEMQEALSAAAGLCFVRGRVCGASVSGDVVRLQTDEGRNLEASRVVLATGFDPRRPGGRFIDRAVAALDLPVSGCGYPVAGDDLQWGRSVFVTGPLAELRIGPCARNIAGARNAGRLLLSFLKKKKST